MAASTPYPNATTHSAPRRAIAIALQDLETDEVIGIVGGLTALIATALSWYTVSVGTVDENASFGFSLWHTHNFAAWLVLAASVVGIVSLALGPAKERVGGIVAAIAGFAIMLYSVVAMFDTPSFLVGTSGAAIGGSVDVGPFVALLGGFLLLVGGISASDDGRTIAADGVAK